MLDYEGESGSLDSLQFIGDTNFPRKAGVITSTLQMGNPRQNSWVTHLRAQGKSYQCPGFEKTPPTLRLTFTLYLSNCTLDQPPFYNNGHSHLSVFIKNNTADVDNLWDLDPTSSVKETAV